MATLERIRQRSGLLLIVIGLAMAAFILTDLLGSGNSILRGDANVVGEINGVEIDALEFNRRVDERLSLLQRQNPQQSAGITRNAVANQIWVEYQEEVLVASNYDDLGLSVSGQELFERITQNPQVRQQEGFRDPVTGNFSPATLKNYISQIRDNAAADQQAAQAYDQWLSFEEGTHDQVLRDKYLYAVRKGLYMPSALAKADYDRRNQNLTVQYFGLEFNSIADSTVEVSEADMKAYYNANKEDFKSDNTREIAFVTFEVKASDADKNDLRAELNSYLEPEIINRRGKVDTLPSFYDTEDDSVYAVGRSDALVNPVFQTKEEIAAPYDSIFFAQEVGYIHGPFERADTYVLSKISAIGNRPDSVRARHILISYQGANNGQSQATRAPQEAKNLADSLIALVREDSTQFGALATQFTDDPGSKNSGGFYDWFTAGSMVPAFNDFCFYRAKGDIGMVFTNFGIHIIQVLDQMGENKVIKLTEIVRTIEASDATRDSVYDMASAFASKANDTSDFAALATSMGYAARPAANIDANQENILGIGSSRDIVRWVHNDEVELGAIDLFNQDNNSFIVTQLTQIRPEDYLPMSMVEDQVRAGAIRTKKAEMLKAQLEEKMGENADINSLAAAFNKQVQTQAVNFGTASLTGYGAEPKVIGQATGLADNTLSNIIEGERGVYLVNVANRTAVTDLTSYASEQIRLESAMSNAANQAVLESLKNSAEVEDNRKRFY